MNTYILCFTLMVAGVAYTQADTSTIFPQVESMVKQTIENLDATAKKFQELTGIKTDFDKTKVEEFVKKNFAPANEKIQELLKNLEAESGKHGEEFKKNVDSLVKQFNEFTKQINNPDVQGKVQKLQETFQQNLKKIVEQTNEVGKSVGVGVSPTIQKTINEMYEEINKSTKIVQEKMTKVVADVQAEIKKKASS